LILSSSVYWPRLVRHPAALPEEKVRPQLRQLLATNALGDQCGSDA